VSSRQLPFSADRRMKLEFVSLHIDLATAEANALGFQSEALFEGRVAAQLDFSAGAEHTLPRQSVGAVQHFRDLASMARQSCRTGHSAVGGYFPTRNAKDRCANTRLRGKLCLLAGSGHA